MSTRFVGLVAAVLGVAVFAVLGAHAGAARHGGRHRRHAHAQAAPRAEGEGEATCRTAGGTPYDPDIIGGVNHVGDGGPAVNLGAGLGNPCSAFYLGGPGLLGPR